MNRGAVAAGQTLRALRHRNFRLFFAGQLLSLIGTWMQSLAQGWLVWRMSHSEWLLGVVAFAQFSPILFLGLFGGLAADRYNRHRIVLATQTAALVQATLLAALTLAGAITIWEIVALAALLGTINAFDMPGRQSFLVQMVGKEDLGNAIALNSTVFNGARIVGPALAGIVVGLWGEGACFAINAVSFLAVLASLLAMRIERAQPEPPSEGALKSLWGGLAYAFGTPHTRALLLLMTATSLTSLPFTFFLPAIAGGVLKRGPSGLGALLTCFGAGALIGALAMAYRSGLRGLGRIAGLMSMAFGVFLALFALSQNFYLSCGLLVGGGFTLMCQMAAVNTCLQSLVPEHLRGRLMSLYTITFIGLSPLGGLLQGRIADLFGVQEVVAAGALFTVVAGLVYCLTAGEVCAAAGQPLPPSGAPDV
jgi:MFS family permease